MNNPDIKILLIGGPRNGEVMKSKLLHESYNLVEEDDEGLYVEMHTDPMSTEHVIMYYTGNAIEKNIDQLISLLNEHNS